jgi:hypothetical protein
MINRSQSAAEHRTRSDERPGDPAERGRRGQSRAEPTAAAPSAHVPELPKDSAPGAVTSLQTSLFIGSMLAALALGYSQRDEYLVVPKDGVGYWLGIVGSLMMLGLLLYPLRKTLPSLQRIGTVAGWFRWHMLLGVLGPVLILFHSGFRINATNSAVAMLVMATVVVSGIIGRYLYARLHIGIYGTKSSALALIKDAEVFRRSFGDGLDEAAPIQRELALFVAEVLPEPGSIIGSIRQLSLVERQSRARHFRLMVEIEAIIAARALRQRWSSEDYETRLNLAEGQLNAYFACLKRATAYRVYERLFSGWHVLHMPLFFLLIFVVLAHVFAVHWY